MTVAERREHERAERRNLILDAAQRAFYAKGYDLAKMEDVAEEAEVAKGTLYNYFRAKRELLTGLVLRHQQQVRAMFERERECARDGLDLVRRMLLVYASHMSSPIARLKIMVLRCVQAKPPDLEGSHGAGEMRDNATLIFRMMCSAIERGQEDGSIRPDLEPGQLCLQLWSCVTGALLIKLQIGCLPKPSPLSEMAPDVGATVDLLLDAIRP